MTIFGTLIDLSEITKLKQNNKYKTLKIIMKKTFLTLLVALGFAAGAVAQEGTVTTEVSATDGAKISFEKKQHNFGNITEGTKATVTFTFVNEGTEPLVLSSVRASCGCTTPKWTNKPVAPGETGEITAIYNSQGRPGNFTKTITVKHNGTGGTEYLTIRGFVDKKAATPASPVQVQPN
jgi:hypothetical protein